MLRYLYILLACTLLVTPFSPVRAKAADHIVLSLPESILAEALSAVLPLDLDATSKTLQGSITIINISNLKLTDQRLSCQLHLAGKQLQFLTEVGGHDIRLKVGEVEVDFKMDANLRFDPKLQTLYITPVIDEVAASKDASGGDIGHALVSLLNNKEFPVDMQDIDPIVARSGAKTVTINSTIADVQAKKGRLHLYLTPKITVK